MNGEDFNHQAHGSLVKTPEADWAFVPATLPPSLSLDLKMVNLLTDAERSLGELQA
jgi:hypothetical protein